MFNMPVSAKSLSLRSDVRINLALKTTRPKFSVCVLTASVASSSIYLSINTHCLEIPPEHEKKKTKSCKPPQHSPQTPAKIHH